MSRRSFLRNAHGLAAIEFALIAGFLSVAVLNVSEVSVFLVDDLQVGNATQMGAQAAWATCDLNHVPATLKCPNLSAAVAAAVQATALGSSVTLRSGSPSEGFYCVNSGGSLQFVGSVTSPPADCTAAGVASTQPADYIEVQTTYTYRPIFSGLSVGGLLPRTITSTSWVRLGGL